VFASVCGVAGIWQPKGSQHSMTPGRCKGKAHRAEYLGTAGRRVLVSREWSNKTLYVRLCSTSTRIAQRPLRPEIAAEVSRLRPAGTVLPPASCSRRPSLGSTAVLAVMSLRRHDRAAPASRTEPPSVRWIPLPTRCSMPGCIA